MLTHDQIFENPEIKVTNYDEHLVVFNYRNVDESSSDIVKKCKGAIFSKDHDLVVQTGPFVEDLVIDKEDFTKFEVFEAYEGTAIRVFFYSKWYVSTYKRLDAFSSYWGSPDGSSFGEIFEKRLEDMGFVLDQFLNTLNRDLVYVFLLRPSESTRLVSHAKEQVMLYEVYENHKRIDETLEGFESPKRLSFETVDLLKEHIENVNWEDQIGVILKNDDRTIRILNTKYSTLLKLRDPNVQDVGIRYLLLNTDERVDMKSLFPLINFDRYVRALRKAVTKLYNVAIRRKSAFVHVTPTENTVLKYYEGELTLDGFERTLLNTHKYILQKIIQLNL